RSRLAADLIALCHEPGEDRFRSTNTPAPGRRSSSRARAFLDPDQPVPPPPDDGEPRPRPHHRSRHRWDRRPRSTPPAEPRSRRAGFDPSLTAPMLLEVHQDIYEPVPHLARRAEGPGVVTVTPYRTPASESTVDGARDADGEAPHAFGQGSSGFRFDEEVEMIVLHREMNDPEALGRSRGQRMADGREDAVSAKAADATHGPQGDMEGMGGVVRWPGAVGDTGAAAGSQLAPGPRPAPTPGAARGKDEGELRDRALHGI